MGRIEELRSNHIEPIELDVTDEVAIRALVDHVILSRGHIDVSVNNAGFGQLGTIECVSMEACSQAVGREFVRICSALQAVLPQMRKQKSGHIVNITSVMGRISTPDFGWYAA
jgi:short-subunit dehydrogenase